MLSNLRDVRLRAHRPRFWSVLLVLAMIGVVVVARTANQPASAQTTPSVALVKSVSNATPKPGEPFTYLINYRCASTTVDCLGVNLIDVLPPGLSAASGTVVPAGDINVVSSAYDEPSHSVTWTMRSPLPAGTAGQVSVQVQFPSGTTLPGTPAENVARATGTNTSVSNSASVAVTAGSATMDLRPGKALVTRGYLSTADAPRTTTYRVSVCSPSSVGGLDLLTAMVVDQLPAGTTFESATGGATYNSAAGTVTWAPGTLHSAGACVFSETITVSYTEPAFAAGQNVTNNVELRGTPLGSTTPVSFAGNVSHPLVSPALEIGVGKSTQPWATIGQSYTYHLSATNTGGLPAATELIDTFPKEFWASSIVVPGTATTPITAFYAVQGAATTWLPFPANPYGTSATVTTASLSPSAEVAAVRFQATLPFANPDSSSLRADVSGSIKATDRLGGAVADGTSVSNCTTANAAGLAAPIQACDDVLVTPPFAVPSVSKAVSSGSAAPGDEVTYTIMFSNAGFAAVPVNGFVLSDQLDSHLAYVSGSMTASPVTSAQGAALTAVVKDPTVTGVAGKLEWNFAAPAAAILQPGDSVSVSYRVKILRTTAPGPILNAVTGDGWINGRTYPCDNATEIIQLAGDRAGGTGLPTNPVGTLNGPCATNVNLTVIAVAGVESAKWVKGDRDGDDAATVCPTAGDKCSLEPDGMWRRYPKVSLTQPGGKFGYLLRLRNPGNVALNRLTIIDILPHVGDTGVVTPEARDSRWSPSIDGPIVIAPTKTNAGLDGIWGSTDDPAATPLGGAPAVTYSVEKSPCRPELDVVVACVAPNWRTWSQLQTAGVPLSDIHSFKVDLAGVTLGLLESLELRVPMMGQANAPADEVAWNSFGVASSRVDTGNPLLATEPIKVGIKLAAPGGVGLGDKVWIDFDHDGLQDPQEDGPIVTAGPDRRRGVNGLQVRLYDPGTNGVPGGEDDVLIATTHTAPDFRNYDGYYFFPGLTAGAKYFVAFDNVPVGTTDAFGRPGTRPAELQPTIANAANPTGDATLNGAYDSDGIAEAGGEYDGWAVTSVVTLADVTTPTKVLTTLNDPTWDMGFYNPNNLAVSLGDHVWYDSDRNGQQDATDAIPRQPAGTRGINNVSVKLTWAGPDGRAGTADDEVVGTTTTGNDPADNTKAGWYSFDWLVGGTYFVDFTIPAGYAVTERDFGADATDSDPDRTTGRTALIILPTNVQNYRDPTIDAGLWEYASIGNFVWKDYNADGIQDIGEPGVGTVTVKLRDALGGVLRTTTTDSNGFYLFDRLDPGTYSIDVDPPTNWQISPRDAGADGVDSDIALADGTTINTDLALGEHDRSWDGGIFQLASLGDRVWIDNNGNGTQDTGETGVDGVTVRLLNAAGDVVTTTTTAAGTGNYQFADLRPGTYSVQFVLATLPTGYVVTERDVAAAGDTTDSDGSPTDGRTATTTLISGQNDPTWDLGVYVPASIGNRVWLDVNGDGQQGATEAGVTGVTVNLLNSSGTQVATTTTGTDGAYNFSNLRPGDYRVEFIAPTGMRLTTLDAPSDDTVDSDADRSTGRTTLTSLTSGENDPTWDAGVYQPAAVGDRVWHDTNANGIQDTGETGVANVTVELLNTAGTPVATTTTNDTGDYRFTGLQPGTYSIRFSTPTGYTITLANQQTNDAVDSDAPAATATTTPTELTSGETDLTWDLGLYLAASLGDRVWLDTNGNGTQDTGETGVAGVTVNLLNNTGGFIRSTTTNDTGNYQFTDLAPGTYAIEVIKPTGYTFTLRDTAAAGDTADSDTDTTTGRTNTTVLVSGENDPTWDAGLYQPASLGDRVWIDTNGNGTQDTGETGVAGVTVNLLNNTGGFIRSTTTNDTGNYRFTDLAPGTYSVQFVLATLPTGYVVTERDVAAAGDTADSDGSPTDGRTATTTLISGQNDPTWDLGVYLPAARGSLVWLDVNGNGKQDAGEGGVGGVFVELLDVNGSVVASMTTPEDGSYFFSGLRPGQYRMRFTLPNGYVLTPADQGADDTIDSDVDPATRLTPLRALNSAETDPTWDAGVYQLASIGDRVWQDTNGDGSQNDNEPGAPLVRIELLDAASTVVATTTTDLQGNYRFSGLRPGDYSVRVVPATLPNGFVLTGRDESTDAVDSDADRTTGRTAVTALSSGEYDPTWDFGVYVPASLGNKVWEDIDGDGIQDDGEPAVANVTVELLDHNGAVAATTMTDTNGIYGFTGLRPDTYSVHFVAPAGMKLTVANTGTDDAVDSDADPELGTTAQTVLESGENDPTWDAGLYRPAAIGGVIWHDTNVDGIRQPSETALSGVQVTLADATGRETASTTTDTNGRYHFTGLAPGDYSVQFTPLPGYRLTYQDRGTADTTDSDADVTTHRTVATTLISDEDDTTWDGGIFESAAIGDRIWEDRDGDGKQSTGEPGLAGITVQLLDVKGDVIATATTDANGHYLFDELVPGEYRVRVLTVTNAVVTAPASGTDRAIDSNVDVPSKTTPPIVLTLGQRDLTIDAGVYTPIDVVLVKELRSALHTGALATYHLTVRNDGPGVAYNTTVVDSLPNGLAFVQVIAPGWTCSAEASRVTCVLDTPLPAGQTRTLDIETRVTATVAASITNNARVLGIATETSSDNNTSSASGRLDPPQTSITTTLARTGAFLARILVAAVALVLLGSLFMLASRRRRFQR